MHHGSSQILLVTLKCAILCKQINKHSTSNKKMTIVYIFAALLAIAMVAIAVLFRRMSASAKQAADLNVELEKRSTELRLLSERLCECSEKLSEVETENKKLNAIAEAQAREIELMGKQASEAAEMRERHFAEQLRTAKEELTNMTSRLLEQNASKLKERNAESMGAITQPLKDAIGEVRRAIGESMKDSERNSASLREQLKLMMESSRAIGEKAESLVNVLRRDNKTLGNMGEIILGDLLASQGLKEGIHYEVQERLRDETGRTLRNDDTGREMQPDVILHYPQGQDAIIDSKVSLTAYERYVNAQTPEEKEKALQEHIRSVRQHVAELAKKDYSRYVKPPREAVDFVIMFMPFESSLQLALANDPTLWRDAFERKVFITGEQNLLGILHIIHIAWVQNQQAENQERVFGLAEQLLDRLGDFIKRYKDLGDVLEKARKAYDFADNKLMSGNQSVVKKGRELVEVGAKENPNRKIPIPQIALPGDDDEANDEQNGQKDKHTGDRPSRRKTQDTKLDKGQQA